MVQYQAQKKGTSHLTQPLDDRVRLARPPRMQAWPRPTLVREASPLPTLRARAWPRPTLKARARPSLTPRESSASPDPEGTDSTVPIVGMWGPRGLME
jgi:hypothetical protein